MILVSELQYFPSINFFKDLSEITHIVFDQYERYRKMGFRSRCAIAGPNGRVTLSIPLLGGRDQRSLMKDVRISHHENWQARHWKTLTACYNRSPFFDFFRDELEAIFNEKTTFLVEWDLRCLHWAMAKMKLKTMISLSENYLAEVDPTQYLDRRNGLAPSGIDAANPDPERYPQVFEDRHGFLPNLSILDRLFCQGPGGK